MARGNDAYDIFLSYARSDDRHGAVQALAEELRDTFSRRYGKELRIFQDRQEILTADIWKERIRGALRASHTLVAVISSAYLQSEWCRREWNHFVSAERERPAGEEHRNIFPVLLNGQPAADRGSAAQERLLRDIKTRQFADLAGAARGKRQFTEMTGRLLDGIHAALARYERGEPKPLADPDTESLDAWTAYVADRARFVRLLADARDVTIVGQTNAGLAPDLRNALNRKREESGNPAAFWGSLRVVFLDENLLDSVNDERALYPQLYEAVRQRRLAARHGKRSVGSYLSSISTSRWEIFDSPYHLPFTGSLFVMADGSRIVQLVVPRPRHSAHDHLYMEFEDRSDQYFAGAFSDIVNNSMSDSGGGVIPFGYPQEGQFRCVGTRYRWQVQRGGSGTGEWLPAVLAVTWRNRNGCPEPLLQLRTDDNSHGELDRLSHLSTYVYTIDLLPAESEQLDLPAGFTLSPETFAAAARRRVQIDTTVELEDAELNPVIMRNYLYPDRENLHFLVFPVQLPDRHPIQPHAEIHPASVERMLSIRANQALRNALHLYEIRAEREVPAIAVEIAALNLILHGYDDIAHEMVTSFPWHGSSEGGAADVRSTIAHQEQQSRQTQLSAGRMVRLLGLAGLHYREFFTILLPIYRDIGIPNAAESLTAIERDPAKREALARVSRLYQDETVMAAVPVEV